ncbi:unnamed protein product, partial [marine sediment metagenome]
TQVVEVSLDISFDLMITETAPLDSLIQRFGRINRKRSEETIGKLKPVYIVAPPENKNDALPYGLSILEKSYSILSENKTLHEKELQAKIDEVFPEIDFMNIEQHAIFKESGNWVIDKLTHRSKSILFEMLDIDSVACICEEDEEKYSESAAYP